MLTLKSSNEVHTPPWHRYRKEVWYKWVHKIMINRVQYLYDRTGLFFILFCLRRTKYKFQNLKGSFLVVSFAVYAVHYHKVCNNYLDSTQFKFIRKSAFANANLPKKKVHIKYLQSLRYDANADLNCVYIDGCWGISKYGLSTGPQAGDPAKV